jgi:hypothetical protein
MVAILRMAPRIRRVLRRIDNRGVDSLGGVIRGLFAKSDAHAGCTAAHDWWVTALPDQRSSRKNFGRCRGSASAPVDDDSWHCAGAHAELIPTKIMPEVIIATPIQVRASVRSCRRIWAANTSSTRLIPSNGYR